MNKFSNYLSKSIIFILPLFFLPLTRDFFDFNKNLLLMVFALLLATIYLLQTIQKRRLTLFLSPLDLPVFAFAVTVFLALLLSSPNKVEALLQPAGAGTIFALTLLYFFLRQILNNETMRTSLFASSIFLSLIAIIFAALDSFGIKNLQFSNFQFPTSNFTPAGSLLSLGTFLLVVFILSLQKGMVQWFNGATHLPTGKPGQTISQFRNFAISIIIFLGLLSSLYLLLQPQNRPALLPLSAGWQIAVETFKNPKTALFGVGPGNFLNGFTQAKPLELNAGQLWLFRFGSSSNFYLQILTEIGFLGFAAFLWLTYRLWRLNLKEVQPLKTPLLIIFLLLIILPPNLLLLFLLYLFLTAVSSQKQTLIEFPAAPAAGHASSREIEQKEGLAFAQKVVLFSTLPLLLLITLSFYLLGRAYAAETTIFSGLRAAAQNRGQETYDLQRQAIRLNPYHSGYRMIFSQTNLALANSLAAQGTEDSPLSEADRQTVLQLVSQAINNAKLAVQLTPSAITWENLASIYAALVNVAQGADQWGITAYNQAVSLDPANPALRVAFGGIYFSLQALDPAIRQFETAIFLKKDFANAWYNLANAQRAAQKTDQARFSYQQTLVLLDPQSNDYQRVKSELEALPQPPAATPSAELETLTPPASPAAELKPPLELPEEAAPEVNPSPSPSPTPGEETSPAPISPTETLSPTPTL